MIQRSRDGHNNRNKNEDTKQHTIQWTTTQMRLPWGHSIWVQTPVVVTEQESITASSLGVVLLLLSAVVLLCLAASPPLVDITKKQASSGLLCYPLVLLVILLMLLLFPPVAIMHNLLPPQGPAACWGGLLLVEHKLCSSVLLQMLSTAFTEKILCMMQCLMLKAIEELKEASITKVMMC